MHFTLRVALGAAPEALCPLGCVHGSCLGGACVCDAPAANATDAAAPPPSAWAGPGCDAPITPLASGYDVDGSVAESSFAYYWLPLDAATQSNADLSIELAYDQNPAVRAPFIASMLSFPFLMQTNAFLLLLPSGCAYSACVPRLLRPAVARAATLHGAAPRPRALDRR